MSAVDEAGKRQEQARREALDALARGGTAGVDAYKNAQTEVQGYQQKALDQALNAAAGRGANPQAQQKLETVIRMPGDRTAQQLAASQGAYEADMARRSTANADYFAQAQAAVPAIQAATQRDVSHIQALAAAQAASEAASAKKAADDAKWEQEALSRGLAEMQAEAERTRRFNDLQEQQAIVSGGLVSNPTFDPIGAALGGAEGVVAPERVEAILANPMAGATRQTPSGAVIPVTEGLADPHYMGRMLPEAAEAMAQEIARTRIPTDVQAQRDAYLGIYGDDPRTQALARGMFMPPAPTDVAADMLEQARQDQALSFLESTGVVGTPTQTQRFAQGEDPFAGGTPQPRMSPAAAAERVSKTPEKVLNVTAEVEDDTGAAVPIKVYDEAEAILLDYIKQGFAPAEAAERLKVDMEEQLGRDYPAVRETLALVYGGS